LGAEFGAGGSRLRARICVACSGKQADREDKKREIPHFADSVRNDGIPVGFQESKTERKKLGALERKSLPFAKSAKDGAPSSPSGHRDNEEFLTSQTPFELTCAGFVGDALNRCHSNTAAGEKMPGGVVRATRLVRRVVILLVVW
jgi:hypothetical protein